MKLRHTFWKTAGKKPFSDTSGEGLMLKDKDSFQSCLVALTHTIVWCFHLSSTLTEWIAPREAHSVPYSAETRMRLNDASLHCPSYCFTKLCSDWNSQGQSYLLAPRGEKWNLWWKSCTWWGQLGQAIDTAGQLFLPAPPAWLQQLCHSGGPAVTALLRLRHCRFQPFQPSPSVHLLFPFPTDSTEFGIRIAEVEGYSSCRKGMLCGLVTAYSLPLEEWQDCRKGVASEGSGRKE